MPKIKPRTSRRVPPLKDSDFDHEINLVDHSAPVPRTISPEEEALRSSTSGPSVTPEPSSSQQVPPSPEDESRLARLDRHEQASEGESHEGNGEPGSPVPKGPSLEIEGRFTPIGICHSC